MARRNENANIRREDADAAMAPRYINTPQHWPTKNHPSRAWEKSVELEMPNPIKRTIATTIAAMRPTWCILNIGRAIDVDSCPSSMTEGTQPAPATETLE